METVTTLILGILMMMLPAGGTRDAGDRIEEELRPKRAVVVAGKQQEAGNTLRWESLKVTLRSWETDAGTAGKAEWDFSGVEAVKDGADWKLESVRAATVTLTFDEDELWEAAAISQMGIAISGVWIEKETIFLKGTWRSMLIGIPIDFEVTGHPALEEDSVIITGAGTTKVFRIEMGDWVREKILGMINPLVHLDGFDVISPYAAPYEKHVDKKLQFEPGEIRIENGKLVVKCSLKEDQKSGVE